MFKRVIDPAFDMDPPILKDEYVRDYQYYSYEARDDIQKGRIELRVQDTSRYFLPAEAFLEVTGELVTYVALNTPYGNNVQVGFVNTGIMTLFRNASYSIDGRKIETIQDNVEVATTIIGLAAGPTMMFVKDISDHPDGRPNIVRRPRNFTNNYDADVWPVVHSNPNYNFGFGSRKLMLSGDRRRFSCAIPLSNIFGFCRGVRKVNFGANNTFVLYRKGDDNDAIW